jgi:hypothetical protein
MSVYFLRHNDLVKIGFSDDISRRLGNLRNMSPVPLELVGWMPGGKDVEAHLHSIFRSTRDSGEWFGITPELQTVMDLLLLRDLPVAAKEIAPRVYAAGQVEWARLGIALRAEAISRWPTDTHKRRKELITADLGWGSRRVRQLYDQNGHGRLLTHETTALDAWLAEPPTTNTPINPKDGADRP